MMRWNGEAWVWRGLCSEITSGTNNNQTFNLKHNKKDNVKKSIISIIFILIF